MMTVLLIEDRMQGGVFCVLLNPCLEEGDGRLHPSSDLNGTLEVGYDSWKVCLS